MPGFIDTHTHAPQYSNAGTGMDLPLLDWLYKYTFPLEQSFSSLSFAERVYPTVVNRLLRCGTTTAVYFATIHLEASKYLARLTLEKGQRAYIGKVNMDRKAPVPLLETATNSAKDTISLIKYVFSIQDDKPGQSQLVTPIVTPRFAITCTPELMGLLGDIAKEYDVPIQSHLSENQEEIAVVKELFPDIDSYSAVYDHYGLLNQKTIMAHGVYLTPSERHLIKTRGAGISHCPTSNFALCSGVCNVRQLLKDEIKVGLGTDISGGFSKSLLDVVRSASVASRVISMNSQSKKTTNSEETTKSEDHKVLSLAELTYLATMGGAQLLNMDDTIGNFLVGKEFDAVLVDPTSPNSPIDVFKEFDDAERVFEKFMFLGDEHNLKEVYVRGRLVSGYDVNRCGDDEKLEEKILKGLNANSASFSVCHACGR